MACWMATVTILAVRTTTMCRTCRQRRRPRKHPQGTHPARINSRPSNDRGGHCRLIHTRQRWRQQQQSACCLLHWRALALARNRSLFPRRNRSHSQAPTITVVEAKVMFDRAPQLMRTGHPDGHAAPVVSQMARSPRHVQADNTRVTIPIRKNSIVRTANGRSGRVTRWLCSN